ncbi:non-ribosomal peptide synthetase [Cohnella panacarvi]|uniref:non-ribosomal peptide synthetase n=1 Tax=Cohnella panacarvi TaxID=400776 RepID=UPI00047A0E06|nr:non-ribosomal peptide synthetase [Cohnella panacarvi]
MKRLTNLPDVLERASLSDKGIVFIHKKSETRLAYAELRARSMALAARLRDLGIRARDEVIVRLDDPQSFATVFWACLLGGFIPVPLAAGGSEENQAKLRHVWGLLNRPWLVADSDAGTEASDSPTAERTLGWDRLQAAIESGETSESEELPWRANGEDIAFLQFSSGSTGEPKGVVLTHANLLSNMEAIVTCSATTENDSSLSWMPLTHDMGLIGFHLAPMFAGMDQYLMQPSQFMLDPMLWLAKASEHRITSIASPNFGYKHFLSCFKKDEAEGWDLGSVKLIFNGAEPISAEWAERFVRELAPYGLDPAAMFPVYGMAEATLAVTFPPPAERLIPVRLEAGNLGIGQAPRMAGEDDERAVVFVDVGYPVAGCEVRIVGDSDEQMPEGEIGHIVIRGASVTGGYYNNPEASEKAHTADGWLRTGDVGFVRAGRLVITGRHKDIIFVRGMNVYPHDMEKRAEAVDGVGYGKAAVCGVRDDRGGEEDIVLFVQHRGRLDKFAPLAERVRRQLNRETGLDVARVVPIRGIPRTTSGKIQRYKLAERFASGEWDEALRELEALRTSMAAEEETASPVAEEHPEDLLRLLAIWREALGVGSARADEHFQELGGNSLKAALLLAGIRREWGAELSLRDVFDYPTARELIARIRRVDKKSITLEASAFGDESVEDDSRYPATVAQKRMALVEQSDGIGMAYHIPIAFSVSGPLRAEQIQAALQTLADRHETLRSVSGWEQGELVQTVVKPGAVTVEVDVTRCDVDAFPETRLRDLGVAELIEPVDLAVAPMMRIRLWTDGNQRHLLLLAVHHIAADGIGMNVLMKEFAALLNGEALPPLNGSYRHYARREKQTAARPEDEGYWREALRESVPGLDWPDASIRPGTKTFSGGTVRGVLGAESVRAWERLARSEGATMTSLLIGLHGLLVHRYTGQPDVSVGLMLAGRGVSDTSETVGMFNNYVPIRLSCGSDTPFRDYWRRTRDRVWEALEHGELPYERLIALSGERHDPSRNPLFDTMLVYHNQAAAAFNRFEVAGCLFEQLQAETGSAKLDLKLDVFPEPSGALTCVWEYNDALFRRDTVERMASHFVRLAEAVARDLDLKLGEIELCSDEERRRIVETFNDTKSAFPDSMTLQEMFRRQTDRSPDRIAAVFGEERLTYGELDARADRIARSLLAAGLSPEEPVGLMTERSAAMMAGMLGILKAGGAYVPLPPDFPADRLSYMADDCGLRIVLSQRGWLDVARQAAPVALVIDLDDPQWKEPGLVTTESPLPSGSADQLAYILYTSGSTGRPKGVMIRHRSVVNRLNWMQKAYPLLSDDVILQKTPYSFDVSVWELFWWAMAGASVAFLEPGAEKDPSRLIETIGRHRATTMHFVPSMLAAFLEAAQAEPRERLRERLGSLRRVFASGEALQRAHVDRFYALMRELGLAHVKLVNLYGPTEATVDVSVHECEADSPLDFVPIGKPIDNTSLYVVSPEGLAQPVGVPGELCIGGVQLAKGYVNRPDLTAEKFVPNPFIPGDLMYRTGDLARWMEDGQVQYLGRVDDQVKIRGYRIELGEIERTLLLHEAVSETAAAVRDDGSGGKRICGYVVADRALTSGELRRHCAERLPDYMIPAAFAQLEAMPLTASGKADRKALPEPEGTMETGTAFAAPESEAERKLAAMWAELLQREKVGANDNFFELGGHSLKAAELVSAIHRDFDRGLTLRDVFRRPTVRELASLLDDVTLDGAGARYAPIPKVEDRQVYPLSPAQNRLFVLQSMDENDTAYHLTSALIIRGPLDRDRLSFAVRSLSRMHETLRSSFGWSDGQPVQRVSLETLEGIGFEDAGLSDPDALVQSFIKPFRLQESPLLRVKLFRLQEPAAHLLLLDLHHLVADGVSMAVLARQFMALYEGKPVWELPVQYRDYAAWHSEWLTSEACEEQERYWLEELSGEAPTLNLPVDHARPERMDHRGDQVIIDLESRTARELADLSARTGTTLYATLLSAFTALLHRYSGQTDIWVGSPVAGRPHADLADLIGMFVNTVIVRSRPVSGATFRELLEQTKERALGALTNDRYPFEMLVDKLGVRRDIGRNPLFDVMFVLQNTGIPSVTVGDTRFEPYEFRRSTAKFDLTLEIVEQPDGKLSCRFEYRTSLFRRSTMERMAGHFVRLAEEVARDPDLKLGEIELLADEERRKVVEAFNDTLAPFPDTLTLQEMFRRQSALTPDRIAAAFEDERLAYRELDARADRIAKRLIESGLSPEEPVGLMAERSAAMMAGMLGILKAGGAYVPMPPDFPADRLRFMADDCGLRIVLSQRGWLDVAREAAPDAFTIDLDDPQWMEPGLVPTESSLPSGSPDQLAYILYTSGSTGRPKGVMIRHRSVVNRLNWMQKAYPLQADDVILQKTPYSFDVSVWELFWWAMAGASVAFLAPGAEKDPGRLIEAIGRHRATTMHFVPSMLAAFLEAAQAEPRKWLREQLGSLRRVFASGEALHRAHVDRFHALMRELGLAHVKLVNLYGPTEATVDVSVHECEADSPLDFVPIGKPIDNTSLYVVSPEGLAQPVGVPGELCIGGVQLAKGYANRPDLTAEKFVPNPFIPGELMYRTGDLARWMEDGQVQYLGRIDDQVKIRGYRIELGEIERTLLLHEAVSEAAAAVRDDGSGGKRICGYVVADRALTSGELRRHCAERLPEYMIPAAFAQLEAMPLTASGKADRKALPEPEGTMESGTAYAAPESETERKLAALWAELLQREKVGANDNFFELGGNSLLLVRMHREIEQLFGGSVSVTDLFAYPTIAKLAEYMNQRTIPRERKALIPLRAPEAWLPADRQRRAGDFLQLRLDPDTLRHIRFIAERARIATDLAGLAIWIVVLARAFRQPKFDLPTVGFGRGVRTLAVDLASSDGFPGLLAQLNDWKTDTGHGSSEGLRDRNAESADDGVVPMYRNGVSEPLPQSWKDDSDLTAALREAEGAGMLQLEYNAGKIRKEKAKELLQAFPAWASRMAGEWRSSETVAAVREEAASLQKEE